MTRECHAGICEGLVVKTRLATRPILHFVKGILPQGKRLGIEGISELEVIAMKRLFSLLFLMASEAWAKPDLRHAPFLQGFEITDGKTTIGYCAEGAYSGYVSRVGYCKMSLGNTLA